jgi:cob(I)alamin adenosyltransferase
LHSSQPSKSSGFAGCCLGDNWLARVTQSRRLLRGVNRAQSFVNLKLLLLHFFSEPPMGNRLSQIATRTGDAGTTGLGDNTRVSKNSLRVHAMGEVDELNSNLGVLLCEELPESVRTLLVEIQHQLFNLGGELSIPGFELLKPEAVAALDDALEEHNAALPKLKEFILPAGTRAASIAHVCRTVARRAERAVVALGNEEAIKDAPRQYLNRLSDLMFVLSRVLNRMHGGDDVYWKSQRLAAQQDDAA